MAYPTKQDKELYQKDIRDLVAETGDPNAFIIFNDPDFEKARKQLRKEGKFSEEQAQEHDGKV